ncbi:MAG: adenylosuccinate lyase, partial [Candidatus Aenigmarchaeota archaeon]|nr:adenylosuccinate lyase [Candidatus Aenigmarchaeota archaeon]
EDFEKTTLDILGLKPALHSTQIVPPEPMTDLSHAAVSTFSVLANFADDMRNLQRSEISEVGEMFGKDQVGSSTMPHKRNPITFENIKSIYKAFMPRMTTVYLDQISEHQRDLTNSASQRFLPELFGALYASILRMTSAVKKLSVDKEHMIANFNKSKEHVAAEPLYILLAKSGHPDAHEAVRKLTLLAQKEGKGIVELAENDASLKKYIEKISPENMLVLKSPEKYTGRSAKKTDEVCTFWKKKLNL